MFWRPFSQGWHPRLDYVGPPGLLRLSPHASYRLPFDRPCLPYAVYRMPFPTYHLQLFDFSQSRGPET